MLFFKALKNDCEILIEYRGALEFGVTVYQFRWDIECLSRFLYISIPKYLKRLCGSMSFPLHGCH